MKGDFFMSIDLTELASQLEIQTHSFGRIDFSIEILRKIGFERLINETFTKSIHHQPDIPYGTTGLLLMANLICAQAPLYQIPQTFKREDPYDFKGTFGQEIKLEQLTDDRFAMFLDRLYEVGSKEIFTKLMVNAMTTYGIKLDSVNFDTTSKIMWGSFETPEGKETSSLEIGYGHSKQKRQDKKQLKLALGVSSGVVVSADVLSGAVNDKSFNSHNLARFKELNGILESTPGTEIYYIADSAAATKKTIQAAQKLNIKLVTRMPDSYKVTKTLIDKWLPRWLEGKTIHVDKVKKGETSTYHIFEDSTVYEGVPIKVAICYSYPLEQQKSHTIERECERERARMTDWMSKEAKKLTFSCESDALKRQEEFKKSKSHQLIYHEVEYSISTHEQRAPGRAPKNPALQKYDTKYTLNLSLKEKENIKEVQLQRVLKESTFMLMSTDLNLTAEDILRQYKTQSSVEVKFQQFKSVHFVNSLFVKKIERVEALMYLYLIALQVCSIVEYVVRRGLKCEDDFIIGRGRTKQYRPTFRTIFERFDELGRRVIRLGGKEIRQLGSSVSDDHLKILRYLGLDINSFKGRYS